MEKNLTVFDTRRVASDSWYYANWRMYGGNVENTNRSELPSEVFPIRRKDAHSLRPVAGIDLHVYHTDDTAIVVGNFLYVITGSLLPIVQKIDLTTLNVVWENLSIRTSFDPYIGRVLLVFQGSKMFIAIGREVVVLDTKTGTRLRTLAIGAQVTGYLRTKLNRLFVGTANHIIMYQTDTWQCLDRFIYDGLIGDFVLGHTGLYVIDSEHKLYIDDFFTKKPGSFIVLPPFPVLTPIVSDNAVYLVHVDGAITRYTLDGRVSWKRNLNTDPKFEGVSAATVGYERVYAFVRGILHSMTILGEEHYSKDFSTAIVGTPHMMLSHRLIYLYDEARLLILAWDTGEILKVIDGSFMSIIPLGNRSFLAIGPERSIIYGSL